MTNTTSNRRPALCDCPDDRCAGYHHEVGAPCGCADALAMFGAMLASQDAPAVQPAPTCPNWCQRTSEHAHEWAELGAYDHRHHVSSEGDPFGVDVIAWQTGETIDAPVVDVAQYEEGILSAGEARTMAAALVRAAELVEGVPAPVVHAPDAGHLAGCDRAHGVEAWELSDVLPRMRDRVAFDDFVVALRASGVKVAGTRTPRLNAKGERCGYVVRVRSCELLRFRAVQAATDRALADAVAASVRR